MFLIGGGIALSANFLGYASPLIVMQSVLFTVIMGAITALGWYLFRIRHATVPVVVGLLYVDSVVALFFFYIAGEFETGDGMSSGEVHVDVEVEVRCRFGLDSSNNAGRLAHPMSAAHAKWCAHAAQVIIQDKIGETARTLDATNAYGIIGPIGASDIAVDERHPDEGRPASVVQFDAIASVTIRQTQYRGWVTA